MGAASVRFEALVTQAHARSEDQADKLNARFEDAYRRSPGVWTALARAYGLPFFVAAILKTFQDVRALVKGSTDPADPRLRPAPAPSVASGFRQLVRPAATTAARARLHHRGRHDHLLGRADRLPASVCVSLDRRSR